MQLKEIRKPPGRRTITRTPETKPEEKKPSGRRIAIVTTVALCAIIAISIVVGLYFSVWKDLWRPIITVNDETINMGYIIRRMKYVDNTTDVLTMINETIINEMLIRQGADRYNIEVTPDEIDEVLRDIARGENETISENEFNHDRPMLSALAVTVNGLPGKGFFTLAQQLGLLDTDDPDVQKAFWEDQQDQCYETWQQSFKK